MKKYLIFVVGIIIIGIAGTSYAAYKLKAEQVSFNKTNTGLNSDDVQGAIDELSNDILSYGDATANDIKEGKTALVNGKKITGTLSINEGASIGKIYSDYQLDALDSGATYTITGFDTIRFYLLGNAYDRYSRLYVDGQLVAYSNSGRACSGTYHIDPNTTHTIKVGTDYKIGSAWFSLDNTGAISEISKMYSNNEVDAYDAGTTVTVTGFNTILYGIVGNAYDRYSRFYVDGKLIASNNTGTTTTGEYKIDPNTTHTIKVGTDYKIGSAWFSLTNK